MGAARLVHRSRACGPLTIVDDAISLEILVSLAVLEQDPGAAEAWLQLAEASEGSRIAQPSIHRMRSRVRLLEGDPERAIAEAERAATLAEREGRQIEAAEAEILTARARVAAQRPGEAAAGLSKLLLLSDASGHRAARRDAAIEMRSAGRRLGPALGDELTGLSARELDVAMLIAAGLSNAEIAATLFLSPHTVRAHVSRVLTAFGAASRLTVAARVGALLPAPDEPPPPLTGRQLAVARG
ncbi:MAG: helix-turn-helix transcriptional regulator, partial [Leucobacter sp.]|nr:helix-turn-helix transcriptional regulator [Leucobacter sp.]